MTRYSYTLADGSTATYVDGKRSWWLLSVVYPLFPVLAVGLHAATGSEWLLLTPIVLTYGAGPLLDWWWGEDLSNPPEQTVPELEADRYYRILTWLTVPLHLAALIISAVYAATAGLSLFGLLALAVVAGMAAGLAVNTAHEMGHKRDAIDQWLSRIALAVPFYGHFTVEHNFGHHREVATPEDCASARMGESVYHFALREMPGGIRSGPGASNANVWRAAGMASGTGRIQSCNRT
jgi:alkane 1-monooxygenase